MTKNKNIVYGNVELDDDEFSAKNTKVRVTTFIDVDVVSELKKRATSLGIGYQTLLNQKLREVVFGESAGSMEEIISRLEELEKKVG